MAATNRPEILDPASLRPGRLDLQRSSSIARAMVTEYDMSDLLGQVSYERPRQAMFLPESF